VPESVLKKEEKMSDETKVTTTTKKKIGVVWDVSLSRYIHKDNTKTKDSDTDMGDENEKKDKMYNGRSTEADFLMQVVQVCLLLFFFLLAYFLPFDFSCLLFS
jgi:hypothetical protein